MKATAHIKQHKILDGKTALVDAVITSNSFDCISNAEVALALQEVTGHNLVPIASCSKVIEHTPYKTTVRAFMSVASEAIPYVDGMEGFQSVSSNIYMDAEEKIWSLRQSESGKTLVRSHVIDDQAEIAELLNACSNVTDLTANSRDQGYFQAVASIVQDRANPADLVSFVAGGVLQLGIVAATHENEQGMPLDTMTVIACNAENAVSIDHANIVENFGDMVSSSSNPEGYAEPENEMVSQSGNASVEDIVSYWKRVYGHNTAFFAKMESQIRSYQFCNK